MPLDIAIGILGGLLASRFFTIPLSWSISLGILFALLPDVDFIIHSFKKKKVDELSHEHRDLLHNPILYIAVGFLFFVFWNAPVALLFAALSLGHFIHDSVGVGWGIRWLYPFSKRYFKYSNGQLLSWTPDEQRLIAKRHGNPNWLKDYFRSSEFYIELFIFVVAMVVLGIIIRK